MNAALLHLQPRDLCSAADRAGDVPHCRTPSSHGVLLIVQRAHGLAGEFRDVSSSVTVGKRTAYLRVHGVQSNNDRSQWFVVCRSKFPVSVVQLVLSFQF